MIRTPTAASQWPVRTFLIWLVLACLLPGVIGAGALFAYEYQQGRVQLERNTLQTSRALVQAIDNYLFKVQTAAQALSTSDSLIKRDYAEFHRQARELVALAELGTNVVLRDTSGQQLVNTALEYGQALPRAAASEQAMEVFRTRKPVVSDLFLGPVFKRPIISVYVPVIVRGEVAYVLAVGILPEHFNAILKTQGLPPDWVVGVFDSSGTIVARTHLPEKFIGRTLVPQLREAVRQAREGSLVATTAEGTRVLTSYSTSPLTRWGVAIGIPRAAILGALMRTLAFLVLGVASLFAAGLVMARFMSRRIEHSVMALTAPAIALGEGAPVTIPQVHIKEAAEVATALGRAAGLLKERDSALQARETALQEAYRIARLGAWYWDLKSGVVNASESLHEIFGQKVPAFPEVKGTLLTTRSWEILDSASQRARESGEGIDLELEARHTSGATVWINLRGEPVKNSVGEVVAFSGTTQDITERKNADTLLRESEERFRLLADNIAQLVWMADGNGDIFWYNQRWFDYTGTTPEEMADQGWQKLHHPDHVERVRAKLQRCFDSGEPWEDTFPLRGADGNYHWFLSRAVPERDAAGRVLRWFGTNTDITGQQEIEEELQKFKFFSDNANDGHLLVDRDGWIRYANKLSCERLGYSEAELLRLNLADVDPVSPDEQLHQIFGQSKQGLAQGHMPPFERTMRRKDGSTFPVEVTATVLEHKGEWLMFATSRDITERKQAEERVRAAAMHDWLTGLPNRAFVFEYGSHLLGAAQRGHGRGALLFIDLDRFKPINDVYGHEIGDRVLQEVARRLVACTRREDLVGRIGGDEFVIVLPYLDASRSRAAIVAQHVLASINLPFRIDALELSVSPSIGISYFPEHATDVDALIHAADLAMYHAKQSGRGNFQFYTAELDRQADLAHSLELMLRHALKHDGLRLHYQPVIDIDSGKLIGAEALVRLEGNDGETIGPSSFIPIAESVGLIGEVGEWVAHEACSQHQAWSSDGLDITIAINVSPLQFRQQAFAEKLRAIIADTGMDPTRLEVEVTESAVMDSVDDAVEILNKIKSLGVKVALDDFGTGYSSLSSLTSLPLDKLKVDQSFVRRIESDQASRAVTQAIIALGRSLHLHTVGEGIESEDTLNYLQEHGCNQAQGFWFGEPMPAQEFMRWYRERWSAPLAQEAQ